MTELPEIVSRQGIPYVMTESSRKRGLPCRDIVLYVATVGQGISSQPGYTCAIETLCRDSVALHCVATEKVMRERQTRLGAHHKAGTPRLGVHDRGILSRQRFLCISVATDFLQWLKKGPPGLGCHSMVLEPRFINT